MVGVVQLAEHRIVVPGVVGSSPITHPTKEAGASLIPPFPFFLTALSLRFPDALFLTTSNFDSPDALLCDSLLDWGVAKW